ARAQAQAGLPPVRDLYLRFSLCRDARRGPGLCPVAGPMCQRTRHTGSDDSLQPHPALWRPARLLIHGVVLKGNEEPMAQAVEELLEALEDVDDATREEAAQALADLA